MSRQEKDRQKQIQDKCQNLLNQMLRNEDNKYCVDCDAKDIMLQSSTKWCMVARYVQSVLRRKKVVVEMLEHREPEDADGLEPSSSDRRDISWSSGEEMEEDEEEEDGDEEEDEE
ncbi:hypothetical protein GE061_008491 [Apolygus lucorum]|uniref:Uncharacterized protein n=1 Tax=Apolygus lucorum TaxID=248454 RepID=A0A8S9WKI2_APOLU|nr:hypothetical protein GE061_008491 [Apolygus lucorum]